MRALATSPLTPGKPLMYAVIELGGKQYRVRQGEYLTVDRVRQSEGETFTPTVLFAADGDTAILDPKELALVAVTATVDAHLLGPKIRVFTYRAKHSSKKMRGHRSRLSKVTITEIALKKRAAARPRRKAQAEAAAPEGD
jgi:large subunit ribosomal protein L21